MTSRSYVNMHAPRALKPKTKTEIGYFLAGLIDSDGHINNLGYVVISFNLNDISVAYYIRKIIGYGSVTKVQNKHAAIYICSHQLGLTTIANLVRGKLRHLDKINQYNERLCTKLNCEKTGLLSTNLCENHWLAGFLQGDGSLQIKMLKKANKAVLETRLVIQIDQKSSGLLTLIQACFGGFVGYRKSQETYYYSSVNFANTVKFINYLDQFQLMGSQLTCYWLWRKSYIIVQSKQHLTELGISNIALKKEKLTLIRKGIYKKLK